MMDLSLKKIGNFYTAKFKIPSWKVIDAHLRLGGIHPKVLDVTWNWELHPLIFILDATTTI